MNGEWSMVNGQWSMRSFIVEAFLLFTFEF